MAQCLWHKLRQPSQRAVSTSHSVAEDQRGGGRSQQSIIWTEATGVLGSQLRPGRYNRQGKQTCPTAPPISQPWGAGCAGEGPAGSPRETGLPCMVLGRRQDNTCNIVNALYLELPGTSYLCFKLEEFEYD